MKFQWASVGHNLWYAHYLNVQVLNSKAVKIALSCPYWIYICIFFLIHLEEKLYFVLNLCIVITIETDKTFFLCKIPRSDNCLNNKVHKKTTLITVLLHVYLKGLSTFQCRNHCAFANIPIYLSLMQHRYNAWSRRLWKTSLEILIK